MISKDKTVSKFIYLLPVLWAILFRCSISLYGYAGEGKPPLFGDFEAQRHWLEVTVNIPLGQWYHNSSMNDLAYWGLDYPPLTAYHSFILGFVAKARNSSWTSLVSSRGTETIELKSMMRNFVLFTDCLIFIPPLCFFFYITSSRIFHIVPDLNILLCVLFYPGIVLIDHGHFQYNTVSLGLFIISSLFLLHDRNIFASISFCLALGYKQMELYHALPIFFLLLSRSIRRPLSHIICIALSVLVTFIIILFPFFFQNNPLNQILQILTRLFPLSRGLFEDKVSNIWCSLSVFIKWRHLSSSLMVIICTVTTLLASLPSCIGILSAPRKVHRYLYSSFTVSMAFFLFSYQVHEKSILIPATSAILLCSLEPFWSMSFLYFSTLSMWPLLEKDGLAFPATISLLMFLIFFAKQIFISNTFEKSMFYVFNLAFVVIIFLSYIIVPPSKYPFLFPLLISQLSCLIFIIHFLYFNFRLFARK